MKPNKKRWSNKKKIIMQSMRRCKDTGNDVGLEFYKRKLKELVE